MKKRIFLSVTEAKKLVKNTVKTGKVTGLNIKDTEGYTLSADIKSVMNTPPFDNAAMDGYAIRYDDLKMKRNIHVAGESSAGKGFSGKGSRGAAVRIFTGAVIPDGFDTVVMQEKVNVENNQLIINDQFLKKGSNVRVKGSQSQKGKVILKKGHRVTPAAIGYLASNGIERAKVYDKPSVGIIVTGNELKKLGSKLKKGQIYESNEITLRSALHKEGIHRISSIRAKDNKSDIKKAFKKFEKIHDFILISGGISVGDYDFTEEVLDNSNVNCKFYKVRQKPGKPLYFGVKGKRYIFGLPGNPVSVLTCFYEYVLPAIRLFQNQKDYALNALNLPIENSITKKTGMTVFYKARTDLKTVKILPDQESYKMNSFADANCLVVLNESDAEVSGKSMVSVHLLP